MESKSFNPSVSSHGYSSANILFLGGFPAKDDLLSGMALSGYQESMLNGFLKQNHLTLKQCYRSVFIKEQLEYAGSNPKKLKAAFDKIDIQKYQELLFSEIKDICPNVIVPLDDISLSAVFPHINLIKKPKGRVHWVDCYRGSILPLRSDLQSTIDAIIRVIPTLSPQILNYDYTARSYVQIDFKRICDNKLKRGPIEEIGLIWIAKTYQQLSNFFERGFQKNDGFMTLDIETYGGLITCQGFCFDGNEAVAVPLSPHYYPEISKGELSLMWLLIAKVLHNKIEKCGQNVKYDFTINERHGFNLTNVIHDTMLKASLLYPELPKGLDFLTSIYTDMPYYKDEGKNFDPTKDNKDRILFYNAKDALATHIINKAQDIELEENGLKNLYYDEVAPLICIYKDIDETGILIDEQIKQQLIFKYSNLYESNLNILRGLLNNQGFNARSPKQVGDLLYEDLKFPKRTKTDEHGFKSWKTDKDTLDDLLINFGEQNRLGPFGSTIINRVIMCRKLGMVLTYLKTPLHPGNTFRGVSNLGGTETGRSSFSKSLDETFLNEDELLDRKVNKKALHITQRLGRSLQTITKHGFQVDDELFDDFGESEIASDLRSMFVPRRGYCFVEGDGSQAEARVVAVLAEDYDLLESFDKKPKIHAKTAAMCFDIDVNIITKDYPSVPKVGIKYYDLGKRVRHAGNYDMGEFRLAQMTHIPIQECKRILDKFHAGNPKIRGVYHYEVDQKVTRDRILITPFKRRRQFFERINNHLLKQAKAQIPQSTISDQTKFTMRRIKDQLDGYYEKYRFLTEQHDGILAEVQLAYKERYAEAFKRIYERPIDFRIGSLSRDCQLIIPAEMSSSNENWMNLKDLYL